MLRPERKTGQVLDALEAAYGCPQRGDSDPLRVLVRGILSQNTSDTNSARAFDSLMARFGDWEHLAGARRSAIERAIRSCGLAEQKAGSIKAVMRWLAERGEWSLGFLKGLDSASAEKQMTAIKGVGIKTARLVLLFGFGRPVFVVDTHVHRVSKRLALIPEGCTREKAHVLLDALVPDERKYSGHLNMILHGRRCCRSQRPLCGACALRPWCIFVRQRPAKA